MKFIILMSMLLSTSLFAKETKSLVLSKDTVMAGILLTEILITNNKEPYPQKVKVRIIKDVYNADKKLVIPKNTVLSGMAKSFDETAGEGKVYLETIIGDQRISMQVGSADTTANLRGEVRDTRGKFLLGSFISSFSKEARELVGLTASDAEPQITGAGLQGGAHVAQRIAEMYAGDLNDKILIFYVPATIPVLVKTI